MKYTHRNVASVSGVLCCISLVLASLSSSIVYIYLAWGVLLGIGRSMEILSGMTLIAQYFDKKRGRGTALSALANGVGGTIMAPVLKYFLFAYGFSGTMLICGALVLNFTAMGALYRPLKSTHVYKECHDSKQAENKTTYDESRQSEDKEYDEKNS